MSKRKTSIVIVLLWSCGASYILMQQPKFQFKDALYQLWWVKALFFTLLVACLSAYGYLINWLIVHPILRSVAPMITPWRDHEMFFFKAQASYRKYMKGETTLAEFVKNTLIEVTPEERAGAYSFLSVMEVDKSVLVRQLTTDEQELLASGLDRSLTTLPWMNVFVISSLVTTISLSVLVMNYDAGKNILIGFSGLLLKQAASRFF
jgi:hypothetical protein